MGLTPRTGKVDSASDQISAGYTGHGTGLSQGRPTGSKQRQSYNKINNNADISRNNDPRQRRPVQKTKKPNRLDEDRPMKMKLGKPNKSADTSRLRMKIVPNKTGHKKQNKNNCPCR